MRGSKELVGMRAKKPEQSVSIPEAIQCNNTALRKATRRVSQFYDALLAPSGIRSTQRSILIHISRAGQPTMGELAADLVLDRSALAHNLKPLERDGLVSVTIDHADRRSRRVKLTRRGEQTLRGSMKYWKQAQERFEFVLGAKQASALRSALQIVSSSKFGAVLEGLETKLSSAE